MVLEIANGVLQVVDRSEEEGDAFVREFVGDRVDGVGLPDTSEGRIIAYVNADAMRLAPNIVLPGSGLVHGPILIVGLSGHDGHRPLTLDEAFSFSLEDVPGLPYRKLASKTWA